MTTPTTFQASVIYSRTNPRLSKGACTTENLHMYHFTVSYLTKLVEFHYHEVLFP